MKNKEISGESGEVEASEQQPLRTTHPGLVLALLCAVAIFNYVDRQVMGILLEPIKATFGASDTAMGLLTGLMFAGCYALAAVPLARLSDNRRRSRVLAGCLIIWSALTSLGGFAQAFWQLALTRVGVAVAESGAVPASHALISDMFRPQARARAIGLLSASQSVGIGLGLAAGGWIAHSFDWRVAFIAVGVPGLLLAIPLLMLKEVRRGFSDGVTGPLPDLPFWPTVRHLWSIRTYRYLVLTIGLASLPGYGLLAWSPTFLIRVHAIPMEKIGVTLGIVISCALVLGSLLGGYFADRWGGGDTRRYLWIAAAGPLIATPFLLTFTLAGDPTYCYIGLFFGLLLHSVPVAPCYALAQSLVPANCRATASVFMGLASVFVGAGLAPVIVGALNDVFTQGYGLSAIKWSLSILMTTTLLSAIPALLAVPWVRADYARAVAGMSAARS